MTFPFAAILVCALGGTSTGPVASPGDPVTKELHALFDEFWQYRLRREPERATYLGDHRYDDRLYDYGDAARRSELETYRSLRERLRKIRPDTLSDSDRLSAELFERTLTESLELAALPEHLMPIKQQDSPQITLGMLRTYHPFESPRDVENYARRLQRFGSQVDDLITRMDEGLRRDVVRPKITIEQSLPQIDALIADAPRDSPLYEPARTLSGAAGSDQSRKRIEAGVREAVAGLKRLRRYLTDTYLPKCRDSVGYGELPNGQAWYRRLARFHTTTDLTPEAIHQIGLDELQRIRREMEETARQVGFDGGAEAFIEHVRSDPAQYNKSADEIMRRHREILRRSDANLPKLFGRLPKTPYDLKAMEPFRAAGAPAAYYYNAPDDGSRPAYFYVNTYRPETRPIFTMEALAYHEAQPGHHLQLALAQEKRDLPAFRRFEYITAFAEGWGLYAERLGADLGGYRDPYSRFGQLTFDAWRSARLVVDTGIHAFGWTREQAIDFMLKNTALSKPDVVSEIDRYIAWPGQALAYKIGELEILKLRREAEKTLGERFDVRAFHDHLLAEGALPLAILHKRMTDWIAAQSADSSNEPKPAGEKRRPGSNHRILKIGVSPAAPSASMGRTAHAATRPASARPRSQ